MAPKSRLGTEKGSEKEKASRTTMLRESSTLNKSFQFRIINKLFITYIYSQNTSTTETEICAKAYDVKSKDIIKLDYLVFGGRSVGYHLF